MIKIVKEEDDYSSTDTQDDSTVLLHGVVVFTELISSWSRSGCLICADSYFASVQKKSIILTFYQELSKKMKKISNCSEI